MKKRSVKKSNRLTLALDRLKCLEADTQELLGMKKVLLAQDQMSSSLNILQCQIRELRDELDKLKGLQAPVVRYIPIQPEPKQSSVLSRWLSGQW